jgi:hypothetical protein
LKDLLKEIGGEALWIMTWGLVVVIIALIGLMYIHVYDYLPLVGNILIIIILLSPFIISSILVKKIGFGTFFLFVFLCFITFFVLKKTTYDVRRIIITEEMITNIVQTRKDIKEVRVCIKNGAIVRKNPGIEHKVEYKLIKGEKLFVLKEENGWIKFRVTIQNLGWSGWVEKASTASIIQKDSNK